MPRRIAVSFPSSPGQVTAAGGGGTSGVGPSALVGLGRRLREAREAQGLEVAALAERLRIGVEQLQALEAGDRQRLPEPVFVIAQARRVAAALALDIAPQLQALRLSGELATPRRPAPSSPAPSPSRPAAPPPATLPAGTGSRPWPRLPLLAGGGAVLLLVLAGLWGLWGLGRPQPRPGVGTGAPPGAPSVPSPAAGGEAANAGSPAKAQVSSGAGTLNPGTLVLESREPSWVEVRRPDGVILFRGLLRGARVFPVGGGLQVLAGRPDLVSSRIGSAPAQVLGPISEVRWRSLPGQP